MPATATYEVSGRRAGVPYHGPDRAMCWLQPSRSRRLRCGPN